MNIVKSNLFSNFEKSRLGQKSGPTKIICEKVKLGLLT